MIDLTMLRPKLSPQNIQKMISFYLFFSILFPICTLKKNNIILKPLFVYEAHAINYYAAQPILLSVFWFCY